MPIQILPREPSLAALLGAGISKGLATGLEKRAERKGKLEEALALQRAKERGARETALAKAAAISEMYRKPKEIPTKEEIPVEEEVPTEEEVPVEKRVPLEEEVPIRPKEPERRIPTLEEIAYTTAIDPNMGKMMAQERRELLRAKAEEKREILRAKAEEEKLAFAEKKLAYAETKTYRETTANKAKAAAEDIMRLDRMTELVNRKKLIPPLYNAFLSKMGLDIPALKNPDSQEFDKIVSDMTRDIRQRFGARITNLELRIFLKSIPGLSQTDEGKRRVIRNLKILTQGALLENRTKNQIIKENRGIPPLNLQEQTMERMTPELDRLAEEFKTGIGELTEGRKKLTPEIVQKFKKETKGDIRKARQLARDAGYEF